MPSPSDEQMAAMKRRWDNANQQLDTILDHFMNEMLPMVEQETQIYDAAMTFEYFLQFILKADGEGRFAVTEIMCAAAFTRLARAPRANEDNLLAQLEKELGDDHD